MSQNCKSPYPPTRDANNNTLYHGGASNPPVYNTRGYPPPYTGSTGYQQVTANVLFGSVSAINDLKIKETPEREARRTH